MKHNIKDVIRETKGKDAPPGKDTSWWKDKAIHAIKNKQRRLYEKQEQR